MYMRGFPADLQDALESWILLSLDRHLPLPVLDGCDLNVKPELAAAREAA